MKLKTADTRIEYIYVCELSAAGFVYRLYQC